MSQFIVGIRPGATVGKGDVIFDVKIVTWIFDVFNEEHQIAELEVVHQREKLQRKFNKTRLVVRGIFILNVFSSLSLNPLKKDNVLAIL